MRIPTPCVKTLLSLSVLGIACASPAMAQIKPVEAGVIWSDLDARQKCPAIAKQNKGRWTLKWWTAGSANMAVCEVDILVRGVNAGTVSNQNDVNTNCPRVAQQQRARWTKQWSRQGSTLICELDFTLRELDAGFIATQNQAQQKCQALAQQHKALWTGRWQTTQPGQMSVCQLNFEQQPITE
ncbi:MAG: mannan-binding lectin [Thiolinea sp.]